MKKNEQLENRDPVLEKFNILEQLLEQTCCALQTFAQKVVDQNDQMMALLREAVSSFPPLPPKKDEESSKEGEINNPLLSPFSSSQENCSDDNAREEQNLIKKKSRGKKEYAPSELAQGKASFCIFWETYGYKRGKRRAFEIWMTMQPEDREAALSAVGAYKADCARFERQMCWASTYLNQRRWEDDYNSGLENADRANGKYRIITREDIRRREREQRLQGYLAVAEEFRRGRS